MISRGILRFFVPVLLVSLLLTFQNCTPLQVGKSSSASEQKLESIEDNGNGGGYTGKPKGDYYQMVPEYTCEGKPSVRTHIDLNDLSKIVLVRNTTHQCSSSQSTLAFESLSLSSFQTEVIGYGDLLLERKPTEPSEAPANLIEAWCQDSGSGQKYEVLASYDRVQKAASMKLYSREGETVLVSQMDSVSRTVLPKAVKFKAQDTSLKLNLDIDKATLGTQPGTYSGKLNLQKGDLQTNVTLDCRLGGLLDANIWPAKVILNENVQQFGFNKDGIVTLFHLPKSQANPLLVPQGVLGEIDLTNNQSKIISSLSFNQSILSFVLSPLHDTLLFRAANPKGEINLFSFDLFSQNSFQVTPSFPVQYVDNHYVYDRSGKFAIYQDMEQISATPTETYAPSLKIKKIVDSATFTDVSLNIEPFSRTLAYNYSPANQTVFYVTRVPSGTPKAFLYNLSSQSHMPLDLPFVAGEFISTVTEGTMSSFINPLTYSSLVPQLLPEALNERWFFLLTGNKLKAPYYRVYAISAQTGAVNDFGFMPYAPQPTTSPKGQWLIYIGGPFNSVTSQVAWKLLNTKSLTTVDLKVDNRKKYQWIWNDMAFLSISNSNRPELMDLANNKSRELCPQAQGLYKSQIDNDLDSNLYLVFEEGTSGKKSVLRWNSSTDQCIKINSYLGENTIFTEGSISKLKPFMLIKEYSTQYNSNHLYFVPLNGKPTIRVNNSANDTPGVLDFTLINSDSEILFREFNFQRDEVHLLRWHIPQDAF